MRSRGTARPTRLRWLVGAAALLASLVVPLLPGESQATVAISRVTVTNVGDTSFTVSWVTNVPSDGHVRYGPAADQLTSRAEDVRGAGHNGYTHYVRLTSLLAGTRYYFAVTSGDATAERDLQGHLSVTTGPTLNSPPAPSPNYFSGRVLKSDTVTPARGVIVQVFLQRVQDGGLSDSSARLSALTDEAGAFNIDLSLARAADLQSYFTYDLSGDRVNYQADGGPSNLGNWQYVDTSRSSHGASAMEIEISLLNPDPPTPTPSATPTLAQVTPTPTATPSPSPSPTPAVPPSPTVGAQPPSSRTSPSPTATAPADAAMPTPTASPSDVPGQAGATPSASFPRPPSPLSSSRPPSSATTSYAQRSTSARSTPTASSAVALPTTAAQGAPPVRELTSPTALTLVGVGGALLASGLGVVASVAIANLRRR